MKRVDKLKNKTKKVWVCKENKDIQWTFKAARINIFMLTMG